jgi:hypothetical protein
VECFASKTKALHERFGGYDAIGAVLEVRFRRGLNTRLGMILDRVIQNEARKSGIPMQYRFHDPLTVARYFIDRKTQIVIDPEHEERANC